MSAAGRSAVFSVPRVYPGEEGDDMEEHIFGVAEVNQLIKHMLDGEPML